MAFRKLAQVLLPAIVVVQPVFAADDWAARCAMQIKKILNGVYDPWVQRARSTPVASFRPSSLRTENTVVIPTWHMHGDQPPLVALNEQLDDLQQMGVTSIYLPPVSRQMLYDFFGSPNNHGYWPKTYDIHDVDPKLGTWADLQTVIENAQARGMTLVLDVNARHLGYPPADGMVELWGKRVSVKDRIYFIQTPEPDANKAFWAEITGDPNAYVNVKMWDLPTLNLIVWGRSEIFRASLFLMRAWVGIFAKPC